MNFPFTEQQIDSQLFIRVVSVLEGNNWKFQFDEQLPFEMMDDIDIVIPKGTIHRIIKGNGPLKIKVFKNLS